MPSTSEVDVVDHVSRLYTPRVAPARDRFHSSDVIRLVTSPECDPEVLDRFMIQFCAAGVRMTEHVEGWIRRAGERTAEVGFAALGEALQRHAVQERDHHELMIDDTATLVGIWNGLRRTPLDAELLLSTPRSPGVDEYIELHETTIAGDAPYAQIGIEYEIEMLSITAGAALLKNVAALCGQDRIDGLSFLNHHVDLDEGHTAFNHRQLDALLSDHPDLAEPIATAGAAALDAYRRFMTDCLEAAG